MQVIKNIQLKGANGLPVLLDIFFNDETLQQPVIIYSHGFNGFKDWGNFDLVAEKFVAEGFAFVKFNFSHNGTTTEKPEEFNNLEAFGGNNFTKQLFDLKMLCDWICDAENSYACFINRNALYLLGNSMGGGVSILFAAEDIRVKKLVTWASVGECNTPWGNWPAEKMLEWQKTGVEYYFNGRTKQQMPLYYQLYEDYDQNRDRFNIWKAMGSLTIPMLICHGTADHSVPVQTAYKLKEWQPLATLFTLETDHVFGRKHPWTSAHLPKAMMDVIVESLAFLKL